MATLKSNHQFTVTVTRDGGIWIASNDELGLTTEARTYEDLIERVSLIAPELCVENNLCSGDDLFIEYVHEEHYGNERIAL